MKFNRILSFAVGLAVSLISFSSFGQCQDPPDTGEADNENYLGFNQTIVLNIGGYEISFVSQNGEVYVVPGPGVKIFEEVTGNTYNNAALLPAGTIVSSLPMMGFSTQPLFMFAHDIDGNVAFGPWGEGADGFLGIMTTDGKFGYIDLSECGVLGCVPQTYQFIIGVSGFSEVPQPGATTGSCPSLLARAPIPTMGQWGLILISLLVLIMGTVAMRSTSTKQSIN